MTHLHGPVPLGDEFYSERPFEIDLVRTVQAGRWVLLLGPRQHGKTSALIRLKDKLKLVGMHVAGVDLQAQPPFQTYADLVAWFANRVAIELGVSSTIEPHNDISEALSVAVPDGKAPIILLVDEASNISNDEWRNSFYGQLRALATSAGEVADDHVAKRLRFVFSGTFRFEQLVAQANSPFNTCELITTTDLSLADVAELTKKAGWEQPEECAAAVFDEVGGQPYLVQSLIDRLEVGEDFAARLGAVIDDLRTGRSSHIKHLFGRVLADEAMVGIVRQLVQGATVAFSPGDEDHDYLIVLGLLGVVGHQLKFRNALYEHIAKFSPNFAVPVVGEASPPVFFSLPITSFSGMGDNELKEIAYSAQAGAVGSYQGGGKRLALVGYGNALEAVLLDYLLKKTPAEIAVANAACNIVRFHNPVDPKTWTLVNLMRGARAVAGQGAVEIPEALRHWRNLVHPSVCLQDYKSDEMLHPEVVTAAGLLGIVLRDLT